MSRNELVSEGKRQMQICNACRYCEGYCAVWRAIEYRREFSEKDMVYLANLCHDCKDCYFACPFTAPHEFGINPPKLFSSLREEVFQKYSWPNGLARTISNHKMSFWIGSLISFVLLVSVVFLNHGTQSMWHRYVGAGSFYMIISERVLETVFGALGLWFVGGWIIGALRYWGDIKSAASQKVIGKDFQTAAVYAMKLRYLGGEADAGEEWARTRKWFHHAVFYGFLLDFTSTTLGAFYSHVLRIEAPYPVYNPVVLLGIVGGVGIIIGTSGLIYVKSKSNRNTSDENARKSGNTFSVSLLAVAGTGMLVLLFRDTAAMSVILTIHLGTVASLFFTAPYTKFIHSIYRYLSLVRYAQEERLHEELKHKTAETAGAVRRGAGSASQTMNR